MKIYTDKEYTCLINNNNDVNIILEFPLEDEKYHLLMLHNGELVIEGEGGKVAFEKFPITEINELYCSYLDDFGVIDFKEITI